MGTVSPIEMFIVGAPFVSSLGTVEFMVELFAGYPVRRRGL